MTPEAYFTNFTNFLTFIFATCVYWQVWVVCVLLLLLGSTGDAGLSQRKSFPAEIETTLNESRPFFLFFLHRNRK